MDSCEHSLSTEHLNNSSLEEQCLKNVEKDDVLDSKAKKKKKSEYDLDIMSMNGYDKDSSEEFSMNLLANIIKNGVEEDFIFEYDDQLEEKSEWEIGLVPSTSNHGRLYTCHLCDFTSEKSRKMKEHLAGEHNLPNALHRCPSCSYTTTNVHHLKDHVHARHTGARPYKCTYCDYDSVTISNLKRHTFTKHTGDKPNACPHCDYRSVQIGHLKAHVKAKHFRGTPIKCPHCDYATAQLGHLKRHIAKHVGPRKCPHCSFSTIHANSIKKHILIRHTDIRPYQCPHCGHRSAAIGDMNNHVKYKHSGRSWKPVIVHPDQEELLLEKSAALDTDDHIIKEETMSENMTESENDISETSP